MASQPIERRAYKPEAWRHAGARLDRVRNVVLRHLPDANETAVHVVRYTDERGRTCITDEYEGECPPLGDGRTTIYLDAKPGEYSMCCGPRRPLESLA